VERRQPVERVPLAVRRHPLGEGASFPAVVHCKEI
jgi:hypothetical protein